MTSSTTSLCSVFIFCAASRELIPISALFLLSCHPFVFVICGSVAVKETDAVKLHYGIKRSESKLCGSIIQLLFITLLGFISVLRAVCGILKDPGVMRRIMHSISF